MKRFFILIVLVVLFAEALKAQLVISSEHPLSVKHNDLRNEVSE